VANIFKIKISPEDWTGPAPMTKDDWLKPIPNLTFELTMTRLEIFKTTYAWSCLPGNLGAASGSAHFTQLSNSSMLSLFPSDDSSRCFGILDNIAPNFTIGSSGSATIDYSGYGLKRRMEGATNFYEILKEIFKKSKFTIHSKWEVLEAY